MKAEVVVKEEDSVEVAEAEEDQVEEETFRATMEVARTKQLK